MQPSQKLERSTTDDRRVASRNILVVCVSNEGVARLRQVVDLTMWEVQAVHTYREAMACLCKDRMSVVICECCLPDGNWKDILSLIAPLLCPPRLIVTSRLADERLWAEVLNLGGYDVLMQPFEKEEATRVLCGAFHQWQEDWEHYASPKYVSASAFAEQA